MKLRLLTRNEAVLAGLCAVLLALAFRPRPAPRTVVQTRTDTVTVREIARQEPPVKPSIIERIVYREVKPTTVQVAPGAGDLAAVCDTVVRADTVAKELPALVYAGKLTQPWHPWGRQTLTLFAISRAGESVTSYRIHPPAEWRGVPVPVVREARGWRRALKPLPFVAATLAAGYAAGYLSR